MTLRLLLSAAAAALALAGPVLAQEAAPPSAADAAQAQTNASAAEAAMEASADAFESSMNQMGQDMQAAAAAAGDDRAKLTADLDAIVARYQPQADAFAEELKAFIASQLGNMPPEAQAQMAMAGPMIDAQVRGAPTQARNATLDAVAASANQPASE